MHNNIHIYLYKCKFSWFTDEIEQKKSTSLSLFIYFFHFHYIKFVPKPVVSQPAMFFFSVSWFCESWGPTVGLYGRVITDNTASFVMIRVAYLNNWSTFLTFKGISEESEFGLSWARQAAAPGREPLWCCHRLSYIGCWPLPTLQAELWLLPIPPHCPL